MQVLSSADIEGLNLFRRGKVRDTFQLADGTLLMIATDRLSAFDVVLPTPIPGKGTVLTQMSRWWFDQTEGIMPNHLLADVEEEIPEAVRSDWLPRSMHVARAQRIDVECVVRGFISGSGWKEYRDKGTLAGETAAARIAGLVAPAVAAFHAGDQEGRRARRQHLARRAARPRWSGAADQLESASLRLFDFATARCQSQGIYLADTKFEFGFINGTLTLIDEIFTPDSSRFWEISEWKEGQPAVSFDKQFVRDYVEKLGWDKTDPGPALPDDVVRGHDAALRRSGAAHLRHRSHGHDRRVIFAVEVVVALKPVVNDPQGLVVRDGLHRLGFAGVRSVRVGKSIELEVEADTEADAREQVERDVRAAAAQYRDRGLAHRVRSRSYRELMP